MSPCGDVPVDYQYMHVTPTVFATLGGVSVRVLLLLLYGILRYRLGLNQ
jgi:hypothetical protein